MTVIGQEKCNKNDTKRLQKSSQKVAENGVFDRLEKVKDMDKGQGSIWKGNRGIYIVRNRPDRKKGKPVAQVMLNSRYLTGLFPTRDRKIYSADIRQESGKVYLLFHVMGDKKIEIHHRKAVE